MSFVEFKSICQQAIEKTDYTLSSDFVGNVVVYDVDTFLSASGQSKKSKTLKADLLSELNFCLTKGNGVYIVRNGFSDHKLIDQHNEIFLKIIASENESRGPSGDHFANTGVNDRIWNSLQKTCLQDPQAFMDYYSNEVLALASTAWLGPGYQMTAQVNIVKPGSKAQSPHRDYHLGFQRDEVVRNFPIHAQVLSQYLTLQCVIAHSDMPLETGPTKILPFSHQYKEGYGAWRNQQYIDYFEEHFIQYPLQKGDIAFLNPAVFHAAGENHTEDINRVANLMQIVSCMSKPLEAVDRASMAKLIYPWLLENDMSETKIMNLIAAVADGYSFSTNLDTDIPQGECAPQTMAELMNDCLNNKNTLSEFETLLQQQMFKRLA